MATAIQNKTLYYGDCLEWMRKFPDECVDLIYLDPPFNSHADYNMIFGESNGTPAQLRAFTDTWKWGKEANTRVTQISNAAGHSANRAIKGLFEVLGNTGMISYISYIAERLSEMRRLLKPTGSIYFHCDPTASHYVKILMDVIFGPKNFVNEIIWFYHDTPGRSNNYFPKKHDVIFYYSKTSEKRQFYPDEIRVEILAESKKRYESVRKLGGKEYVGGASADIGKIPEDVWLIPAVKGNSKESVGYPTQKPLALLERIIKASSKKDDFVLDPFCGCGTTIAVANELGRQWAGIDISSFAIDVVNERRLSPSGLKPNVAGIPYDLTSARKLAKQKPFDFETWAIQRISGLVPNQMQVRDGGIDGRGTFDPQKRDHTEGLVSKNVVAQVKGGKFALSQFRDFLNVVEQGKFGFGIYITLDKVTSNEAHARAAEFGEVKVESRHYPRVQLWSIKEHFDKVIPDLPPLLDPYTGKRQAQDVQFDEEEETDEPQNGRFNGM